MRRLYPVLSLLVLMTACGGGEADPADPVADAMEMAEQAGGMATMASISEPIPLDEAEMERFVGALEALNAAGERYEKRTEGQEGWANYGSAIAANAEAMAILRQRGYDRPEAFQRVAYTVGAAMAAAEMQGKEAEMAAARKQMEAMKSQMSEQQYKAMMDAQGGAMDMVTNQPDGNVALVQAWKDRIEAAVDDR